MPSRVASKSDKTVVTPLHSVPSMKTEQEVDRTAPVAEPPAPPPAEAPAPRKKKSAKSVLLPLVAVALIAGGGWFGYQYWTEGRFMISTDDAYVQADMTYVTPKITGYVARLDAGENQLVKAGDPIVTIDDGDYRIALAQAEAQIDVQNKTLERIKAQTEAAPAAPKITYGRNGVPITPGGVKGDGFRTYDMPMTQTDVHHALPIYEELPGWFEDISACREFAELPANARAYVERIEELTGAPVSAIGVGPGRDETITRTV